MSCSQPGTAVCHPYLDLLPATWSMELASEFKGGGKMHGFHALGDKNLNPELLTMEIPQGKRRK